MKKALSAIAFSCIAALSMTSLAACGSSHTHTYGDWVLTTTPSTTEHGVLTRTCSGDSSHTETKFMPYLNSTDYTVELVNATCTTDGYCTYTWKNTNYTINGAQIAITVRTGYEATGHSYTSEVTTAATCTEDGVMTYTCSSCGDTYTDAIPATGHSYTYTSMTWTATSNGYTATATYTCANGHTTDVAATVSSSTTPATCTTDGKTVYTATVAATDSLTGEAITETKEVTIPATNHSYTYTGITWTETSDGYTAVANYVCANDGTHTATVTADVSSEKTESTCSTAGNITYTATVSASESLTGTAVSDTKTVVINKADHTAGTAVRENEVAATCTTDASYDLVVYCTECGAEMSRDHVVETGTATGHNYVLDTNGWTWTEDAQNGGYTASASFTCSACGDTKTVSATVTNETTEATCTEDGKIVYTATISAENSPTGEAVTDTKEVTIEATGHDYTSEVTKEATCTEDGVKTYTCSACGDTYTETIPATGHNYEAVVTEPTCTEGGYTTYTCSVCGDSYVADETEATGHSWDEGVVTTAATCTEDGVKTYTCSTCGETKTEAISATGHTAGEAVIENEKAATCTEAGSYDSVVYCTTCGAEISRETITVAATGHTYGTTLTYITDGWYASCTTDGCTSTKLVESDYSGYTFLVGSEAALTSALGIGGNIIVTANISGAANYTVPSSITATLDLNGHTITISEGYTITVSGNLTVKDSGTDGEIAVVSTASDLSTNIVEVDGYFTLESGTLTNACSYGVYCYDGGTAEIKGGTINTKYAAIGGNNTTGDMYFIVSGGTLTATYGCAIFMPGQVSLTITGGTINGGILLRMGTVNISGGTINATTNTDNIDSIVEYYNQSGNIWLADAIHVMAGTYEKGNETDGTKLVINITGGTINCTNGQGSAVAIYDIGKYEQSATVTISGGTLYTNCTTRSAYQVLSLSDMGVTNPASGYGTYSGNVVSNINVSSATELAAAIACGSGTVNITLTADIEMAATDFIGDIFINPDPDNDNVDEVTIKAIYLTIDVAGHTLKLTDTQTIFVTNGQTLTITDSTNTSGSSSTDYKLYLNNNTSTASCINVQSGSKVTLSNIAVYSTGSVLYPKGNAAEVNVTNCYIYTTGVYVIGTNSATVSNYGVVINVENSYLQAAAAQSTSADYDSCVVMINVEGTLAITNSTIVGERQGVIVRAGTATITNTSISCSVDASAITNTWANRTNLTSDWGNGNEVAMGAVVVGNNTTGTYAADAKLTMSGCILSYTITNDTENKYSQYAIGLYLLRKVGSNYVDGTSAKYTTTVVLEGTNSITGYVINVVGDTYSTSTLSSYSGTVYDSWNSTNSAWEVTTTESNTEGD